MSPRCIVLLLSLCLATCAAVQEVQKEDGGTESAQVCRSYCSNTYPEHTYPNADNHQSCVRGCRLAHIEALIAWPLSPCQHCCKSACVEAYSSSFNQYACRVGCNASTIDRAFPNRDHLYRVNNSDDNGLLAALTPLLALFSFVSGEMDALEEHAEHLGRLPGASVTRVTVLSEGGGEVLEFVSYQQYGVQEESPFTINEVVMDYDTGSDVNSNIYDYHYDDNTHTRYCPLRHLQTSAVGRAIYVVSMGLLMFGLFVCCVSLFMPSREEEGGSPYTEKFTRHKTQEKGLVVDQSKLPLDLPPEYTPLVMPFHLSTVGDKTVEGFLTVV